MSPPVDKIAEKRFMRGKERDECIVEWLPIVRLIATSELRRLGGLAALLVIDIEDLVQSGVLGLIAALDRFDPARSSSKTYFAHRIRWAMLDFLRSFPYFRNGEVLKREHEDLLASQPVDSRELQIVEDRMDLERLIAPLPDPQRRVLQAMMYGFAQRSIASMLEITAGRVSQIKTESLAALRCQLTPQRARHESISNRRNMGAHR